MMINPRDALSWMRLSRAPVELDEQGALRVTLAPRNRNEQYLAVVLGTVRRGQPVTEQEVVAALRRLVARLPTDEIQEE